MVAGAVAALVRILRLTALAGSDGVLAAVYGAAIAGFRFRARALR